MQWKPKELQQTCKQSLQLLTLVGNNVVGRRDEGAAGTVDAQLQAKIILWTAEEETKRDTHWDEQMFTSSQTL